MLPLDWGPIYRLGRVVLTPRARAKVSDDDVAAALLRHSHTAWGERPRAAQRRHSRPVLDGCRLLSACRAADGTRFWIITEPHGQLTRVLLPEDY